MRARAGEWFRAVERRGEKTLVHYWYTPDSYDTELPTAGRTTRSPTRIAGRGTSTGAG